MTLKGAVQNLRVGEISALKDLAEFTVSAGELM